MVVILMRLAVAIDPHGLQEGRDDTDRKTERYKDGGTEGGPGT